MGRGGVGSASIVLVFAVLCLTIFTVISYMSALAEQNLIEAEVRMVKAYYAADTLAERVMAEILAADIVPHDIMGVEISAYWDWDLLAEVVSFVSPVSDTTELYVVVAIGDDSYEILSWRMYQIGEWEVDDRLDVWQGEFDEDFFSGW